MLNQCNVSQVLNSIEQLDNKTSKYFKLYFLQEITSFPLLVVIHLVNWGGLLYD